MRRNVIDRLRSHKPRLAICSETFGKYYEAAKRAINIARKACLRKHARDGIFFWLNYAKVKKG